MDVKLFSGRNILFGGLDNSVLRYKESQDVVDDFTNQMGCFVVVTALISVVLTAGAVTAKLLKLFSLVP